MRAAIRLNSPNTINACHAGREGANPESAAAERGVEGVGRSSPVTFEGEGALRINRFDRSSTMKIGFIGLGHMGAGIAANILAAGHELTVWNRSPGPAEALAAKGARIARSPEEALQGEMLFSMLANDDAIRNIGRDGALLGRAQPGLVHANLATISVAFARRLAHAHEERELGYVASPVFGRPDVAAAGTLTIIVAGSETDVARVRPLLERVGRRVERVGEAPEQANLFKIAGNFMLAAAIESMGEA